MHIDHIDPGSIAEDTPIESLYAEVPPGIRIILLRDLYYDVLSSAEAVTRRPRDPDFDAKMARYKKKASRARAINDQVTRLFRIMRRRNSQGWHFAKIGKTEQAIELFEQNVADMFTGILPYERLRAIYTKQKLYDRAIRVCQSYLDVLDVVEQVWSSYPNIKLRPKYTAYIQKLSTKMPAPRSE